MISKIITFYNCISKLKGTIHLVHVYVPFRGTTLLGFSIKQYFDHGHNAEKRLEL